MKSMAALSEVGIIRSVCGENIWPVGTVIFKIITDDASYYCHGFFGAVDCFDCICYRSQAFQNIFAAIPNHCVGERFWIFCR
jgi:hypothetical protein